jgi:hypothetical protein
MKTFTDSIILNKLPAPEEIGFDNQYTMESVFGFALADLVDETIHVTSNNVQNVKKFIQDENLNVTLHEKSNTLLYIDSLNDFNLAEIKELKFDKLIILLRKESFNTEIFNLEFNFNISVDKFLNFIKITLTWE